MLVEEIDDVGDGTRPRNQSKDEDGPSSCVTEDPSPMLFANCTDMCVVPVKELADARPDILNSASVCRRVDVINGT